MRLADAVEALLRIASRARRNLMDRLSAHAVHDRLALLAPADPSNALRSVGTLQRESAHGPRHKRLREVRAVRCRWAEEGRLAVHRRKVGGGRLREAFSSEQCGALRADTDVREADGVPGADGVLRAELSRSGLRDPLNGLKCAYERCCIWVCTIDFTLRHKIPRVKPNSEQRKSVFSAAYTD